MTAASSDSDCAAMIGAIQGASAIAPELIVGKPHPLTAQAALNRLGLPAAECLMVGDRVETDIRMGLLAGTETALVLSGVLYCAAMLEFVGRRLARAWLYGPAALVVVLHMLGIGLLAAATAHVYWRMRDVVRPAEAG